MRIVVLTRSAKAGDASISRFRLSTKLIGAGSEGTQFRFNDVRKTYENDVGFKMAVE